ncbi:MAG: hypothetical protein ACO1NQ_00320 [Flavobacteriales bacterium]
MSGVRIAMGIITAFFEVILFFCVREYVLVVDSEPRSVLVLSKNCVRRGPAQFRVEWEGSKYTVETTGDICKTIEVGEKKDLFYHPGLDKFFATNKRNHLALAICAVLFAGCTVWFFKLE